MMYVQLFMTIPVPRGLTWKPVHMLSLDGVPQKTITPRKVAGSKDLYVTKLEVALGTKIQSQTGLVKANTLWVFDKPVGDVTVSGNMLVCYDWGLGDKQLTISVGSPLVFVIESDEHAAAVRVTGSCSQLGNWQPGMVQHQQTLTIKPGLHVIPVFYYEDDVNNELSDTDSSNSLTELVNSNDSSSTAKPPQKTHNPCHTVSSNKREELDAATPTATLTASSNTLQAEYKVIQLAENGITWEPEPFENKSFALDDVQAHNVIWSAWGEHDTWLTGVVTSKTQKKWHRFEDFFVPALSPKRKYGDTCEQATGDDADDFTVDPNWEPDLDEIRKSYNAYAALYVPQSAVKVSVKKRHSLVCAIRRAVREVFHIKDRKQKASARGKGEAGAAGDIKKAKVAGQLKKIEETAAKKALKATQAEEIKKAKIAEQLSKIEETAIKKAIKAKQIEEMKKAKVAIQLKKIEEASIKKAVKAKQTEDIKKAKIASQLRKIEGTATKKADKEKNPEEVKKAKICEQMKKLEDSNVRKNEKHKRAEANKATKGHLKVAGNRAQKAMPVKIEQCAKVDKSVKAGKTIGKVFHTEKANKKFVIVY